MNQRNSLKISVLAALLALICISAHAAGNSTGYAWSENTGWMNFNPADGGVTVYADHLEGYAWNENIGWIRLGTFTAGTAHTYANAPGAAGAADFGVNNNGSGVLSGYGWSENAGWINFRPPGGGVSIDGSGHFSGYAWAENIGWIDFANTTPAYKVAITGTPAVTTYALTVNTAGTGIGTVGGAANYAAGTTVVLTAVANSGSVFAGWSGPSPCAASFVMPASALTCTATFNTAVAPTGVTLDSLKNITPTSVIAYATATTGADITERGFYWWIPPSPETHFGGSASGLIPEGGTGAGIFSLILTGLKLANSYHIKAYIKVGGQIVISAENDEQIFTTVNTGKMAPTVHTDTKNFTISGNSIMVSGEITDVGSSEVNVYGFLYAKHTAPYTDPITGGDKALALWEHTPLYNGLKFTGTIKNLTPGKWYLRTYAHNINPDSSAEQPESLDYGEEISFTIACTPETCIHGDVNGDGKVELNDAVLTLRILAGIPVGNVNLYADVNGDEKIGFEELSCILQKAAELR